MLKLYFPRRQLFLLRTCAARDRRAFEPSRCRSSKTTCAARISPLNPEGNPYPRRRRPSADAVAAILFYLPDAFPTPDLLPLDDIEAEAQALSWMSFIASTLHPAPAAAPGLRQQVYASRPALRQRLGDRKLFDRESICSGVLAARQFA